MVLTLTDDIIIQSEPEKQDENQILEMEFQKLSDFELTFSNASNFETKNPKRVRFWFKSFTTCHVLDWKKYNALDFDLKFFRHIIFWKIVCIQKIFFSSLTSWKRHTSHFWCFSKGMISNWNFHYVSDIELKKLQRVRFWILRKYNAS